MDGCGDDALRNFRVEPSSGNAPANMQHQKLTLQCPALQEWHAQKSACTMRSSSRHAAVTLLKETSIHR
eukprot:1143372-Pelagomonas_calceolata.AAC.2